MEQKVYSFDHPITGLVTTLFIPNKELIKGKNKKFKRSRLRIFMEQGQCQYLGCKDPLNNLTFDHIQEIFTGGASFSLKNLQILCYKHNVLKGTKKQKEYKNKSMEITVNSKKYQPTETETIDDNRYFFYNLEKKGSVLIEGIKTNTQFSFTLLKGNKRTFEEFKEQYFSNPFVVISHYKTFEEMQEELNEAFITKLAEV